MTKTYAAGGVVIGPARKILVVNQNGDSWSLPKGHIDPGEEARAAAEREIREESGVKQIDYICDLGAYERPRIGKGGVGDSSEELKEITMFLYKTDQVELSPEDPANPEAQWIEIEDVASVLTHKMDSSFFESQKPKILECM